MVWIWLKPTNHIYLNMTEKWHRRILICWTRPKTIEFDQKLIIFRHIQPFMFVIVAILIKFFGHIQQVNVRRRHFSVMFKDFGHILQSCSKISVIFIWSYWIGHVYNPQKWRRKKLWLEKDFFVEKFWGLFTWPNKYDQNVVNDLIVISFRSSKNNKTCVPQVKKVNKLFWKTQLLISSFPTAKLKVDWQLHKR